MNNNIRHLSSSTSTSTSLSSSTIATAITISLTSISASSSSSESLSNDSIFKSDKNVTIDCSNNNDSDSGVISKISLNNCILNNELANNNVNDNDDDDEKQLINMSLSMNKVQSHLQQQQQQQQQQPQQVLPPITYDEIDRNRFIHGSNIFYESFFSQNELERFFPDHKIHLSIITWNMGSKPPNDYNESLKELLQLKQQQTSNKCLPEIFVIGLQETPNSEIIVNNLKVGIQAVLGPNHCLLRWSSVGVLHCSIWLRRELLWSCTTVDMVPIHMRPVAANRIRTKGAITLSFSLFGTSFIFINTHLTAHEINLRSRMNQLDKVQQILNLKYPSKSDSNSSMNNNNNNNNSNNNSPTSTTNNIRDHNSEYIFWFGDLNFRLELPIDIVLDAIRRITNTKNLETKDTYLRKMLRSDQLSNLMHRGIIFNGFEESKWPPPFLPTYKCKINYKIEFGNNNNYRDHNDLIIQSPSIASSSSFSTSTSSASSSSQASYTNKSNNNSNLNNNIFNNKLSPASSSSSSSSSKAPMNNTTKSKQINNDYIVNCYNYESGRVPSYTDRILYQTKQQSDLYFFNDMNRNQSTNSTKSKCKCIKYNSIMNINSSDHKPVYALFELDLDSEDNNNFINNYNYKMKRLSQLVDEMYVKQIAEKLNNDEQHNNVDDNNNNNNNNLNSNSNSNDNEQQQQQQQQQSKVTADSNDILAQSSSTTTTVTSMNNKPSFRRLVDRHLFNRKLKIKINGSELNNELMNDINNLDNNNIILKSITVTDTNDQSLSSSSPTTMVSNPKQWSDRIGQLNAGAYDRKIYMEGMRLRNNQLHGSISQTFTMINQQNQLPNEKLKNSSNNMKKPDVKQLFKSHSFESSSLVNDEKIVTINDEQVDRNGDQSMMTSSLNEPNTNRNNSRICAII